MVKTRKKHNNRKKRNTQRKKRRSTQKKRRSMRRKLIMKKMFGGGTIYNGRRVGKGASKEIFELLDCNTVHNKLAVKISYKNDNQRKNNIYEYMLLKTLFSHDHSTSVQVSDLHDVKQTITYHVEKCDNIELGTTVDDKKYSEHTILIETIKKKYPDVKLDTSEDVAIVEDEEEEVKEEVNVEEVKEEVKTYIISFLEKIITLSNIQIPSEEKLIFTEDDETKIITSDMISEFKKRFVPGNRYFNSDCKPDNFCYQKKNNDVTIKIMDVSVDLFFNVADKDGFIFLDNGEINITITEDVLRCYVFLLYFEKIVYYYYYHKKENINFILEIFKQISSKFVSRNALRFIYDNLSYYQQLLNGTLNRNWNHNPSPHPTPDLTKRAFINNINRFIDAQLIPGEKNVSPTSVDEVHNTTLRSSTSPNKNNPFDISGQKDREQRRKGPKAPPTVQPKVHQDHRRAHNHLNNRLREQYDHHTQTRSSSDSSDKSIFMFGNNRDRDRYGHK